MRILSENMRNFRTDSRWYPRCFASTYMELKQYIAIFKKRKNIIINSAVFLVVLTVVLSFAKPVSYDNDLALLISRNGTQNTGDYKYDGYYAAQASDVFGDNVSQWLASASLVKEIYSRANTGSSPDSLRGFSKYFKARKLSSQYVEVRYRTPDNDSPAKLARAIVDVLQEKADALRAASGDEVSFKIIYSDPLIIESPNNIFLNAALALFGGLLAGIFLALGKEYFGN